jgi:hypothetical protein
MLTQLQPAQPLPARGLLEVIPSSRITANSRDASLVQPQIGIALSFDSAIERPTFLENVPP